MTDTSAIHIHSNLSTDEGSSSSPILRSSPENIDKLSLSKFFGGKDPTIPEPSNQGSLRPNSVIEYTLKVVSDLSLQENQPDRVLAKKIIDNGMWHIFSTLHSLFPNVCSNKYTN